MRYDEFLDYIKLEVTNLLQLEYDEEVECEIHRVFKNNSVELDGLTIHAKGENLAPNIYLNFYYEQYLEGKELDEIVKEIIDCYKDNKTFIELDSDQIYHFDQMRDYIILRLVNYEKNQKLLEDSPYILFHDLAITFRWLAHKDEVGIATSLVTYDEMRIWDVTKEELYPIALENTMRYFPCRIMNIENVLREFMSEDLCAESKGDGLYGEAELLEDAIATETSRIMEEKLELYVLTNETGINGAAVMLYEDVLHDFAKKIKRNLFLLPSSIHEIIMVPDYHNTTSDSLKNLVIEANESVVGEMDVLSDSVYYYSLENAQIERLA